MNKKYKILLFDLDDTLLDFTGSEKTAIKNVLTKYGLFTGEDILDVYYTIENWQIFQMGNINSKTAITGRFVELLKILCAENIQEIADEYYSLMINSHKLISGVLSLLRSLKSKGYKMYITTNGYPEFQYKRIKEARISNYFEDVFISEEIDLRKPTPAFYKYVFNRLPESKLSNILIIGDAQTSDILGGKNAGIDTCWYNPLRLRGRLQPTYEIENFKDLEKIL